MDTAEAVEISQEAEHGDALEKSVLWLLNYFGVSISRAALRARVARDAGKWSIEQCVEALESFSVFSTEGIGKDFLSQQLLHPVLTTDLTGRFLLITCEVASDGSLKAFLPSEEMKVTYLQHDELVNFSDTPCIQFSPILRVASDEVLGIGRYGHWFWGPLLNARGLYVQVAFAALLINLFALSASMFSMIVYDRVMPNGAVETLIALLVGVMIVFGSDFILRSLRSYHLDVAGARADMIIADTLFEHVMDSRLSSDRGSVGSTVSILREFETLREFLTSATMTILIDIPFAVLFFLVISSVGGPLVLVPLLVAPLIIGASLVVQPSLRRLSKSNQADSQTKNAILVESLTGIETIKALGAGAMMRRRWQQAIAHQSEIGLKTRMLGQFAGNVANLSGQIVWVGVVTYGFFLVQKGEIGSGAIVACSMLAGRAIAPLSQLAHILTRVNQSLVSYKNLSELMSRPREHVLEKTSVDFGGSLGSIEFRNVSFSYSADGKGGLKGVSFKIDAGEKVAFVGPLGSGKSTLMRLILGLYQPSQGEILFNGIDSRQYDPADIRKSIGVVMQEPWLFSGSIKENIMIGSDDSTDADLIEASKIACVHDFVAGHPEGYGLKLRERGEGVSGGQRQAITIARALIGQPDALIFDEPTSSFDVQTERMLIERLRPFIEKRTFIVISHRPSLFDLVDKICVMQEGRVIAFGPKDEVARRLSPPNGAK